METDTPTFADPQEFDIERARIARRRKIAEELLATQMPKGYMTPQGWAVGPTGGEIMNAGIRQALGNYSRNKADDDEEALAKREAETSRNLLSSIPGEVGPARIQAQAAAMRMPGLRESIRAQMLGDEATAKRIEAGEQKAEDRRLKEQEMIDRGEQRAADRVAREDLRRMPTIHISNSGGGGGGQGKAPSGYRWSEDGNLVPIPGGPADKTGKPLTQKDSGIQRGYTNMEKSLNHYESLLDAYDPQGREAVSPEKRAAIESAFTDVQMKLKDLYELGAPQAGDMRLLEQSFANPVSVGGTVKGAAFGKAPFKAKVKEIRTLLDNSVSTFDEQKGIKTSRQSPEAAAPTGPVLVSGRDEWRALKPGTPYVTVHGERGIR